MDLSDDCWWGNVDEMKALTASDGGFSAIDRMISSIEDPHRRYLLYHLQEEDPSTLEKAARHVAAWELDRDPGDVPTDVVEQIKVNLYHAHLPKLADLKIIEYDQRSGAIRLRDPPDQLDKMLEITRAEDESD